MNDKLQESARIALLIIDNLGRDGQEFLQKWIGFNAFYNLFEGRNERNRLIQAVCECIHDDEAQEIINKCGDEITYLRNLPPGDLRFPPESPRFRRQTTQDIEVVCRESEASSNRLGHLVAVVYQVRCNLVHGSKDPTTVRSKRLFKYCDSIMEHIIIVLLKYADAA